METEIRRKIAYVILELWKKKFDFQSTEDLLAALEGKLSSGELDAILRQLVSVGYIIEKDALYEGFPIGIKLFQLSLPSILRLSRLEDENGTDRDLIESFQESLALNNQIADQLKLNIEKALKPFKEKFINDSYSRLFSALYQYFSEGIFLQDLREIKIRKVDKKRIGWALNVLHEERKGDNSELPFEYLEFAKNTISIFKNDDLGTRENYRDSNLYNYFKTNLDKNKQMVLN